MKNKEKVIISAYDTTAMHAGSKAKTDIEQIVHDEFGFEIERIELKNNNIVCRLKNIMKKLFFNEKYKNCKSVIIQIPYSGKRIYTNKIKNKIAIIHDIDGIRKNDSVLLKNEIEFYKTFDAIISHNEKMTKFLIEKGLDKNRIFNIEIFDYLCDIEKKTNNKEFDKENIKIVYIGNYSKAPFLKQLESEKMKFNLNFYGACNETISNDKIILKGKFLPNDLPKNIQGDLGLVWDGNYDESEDTNGYQYKNYTKYNNPHKLSGYIAAEIPVIVWEDAAIAEFVKKYNIGYTIRNIYDINQINFSDYIEKQKNVHILSERVREGYYTKKVFSEALKNRAV